VAAYVTAAACCVPLLICAVAVNCCVAPVASVTEAGVNTICCTTGGGACGGFTVTTDVPVRPSTTAEIVACPAATPVTTPACDTVAAAPLLLDHVAARPSSGCPAESAATATNCSTAPATIVAGAGVTVTVATGTSVTSSGAVAEISVAPEPAVARTVVWPGARPHTSPVGVTRATMVSATAQEIVTLGTATPSASTGVADSGIRAPTRNNAAPGVSRIAAIARSTLSITRCVSHASPPTTPTNTAANATRGRNATRVPRGERIETLHEARSAARLAWPEGRYASQAVAS
jgi:hypothetical protein